MPEKLISVPYNESKLGNQNFIVSSRVAILLTASANTTVEPDVYDPQFIGAGGGTTDEVGFGYGADARAKLGTAGGPKNREVLLGAGWRSIRIQQQHNVTQEGALGHYDLIETLTHSVASNTLDLDRLALRARMASRIGVAGWGKDNLTAPVLNAYIYDPKERQRGVDFGYAKIFGLHLANNGLNLANGSPVTENMSYRVDRIARVKTIPKGLLERLAAKYPHIYKDIEQLETFQYVDVD